MPNSSATSDSASTRLRPVVRHLAHAPSQLAEQQAVAGTGRLVERTLVAGVAGEEHRDHVDERTELMAQIDPDHIGAGHRVAVHEHRRHARRPRARATPARTTRSDATRQLSHGHEQHARNQEAGERRGDQHAEMDVDGAADQVQRLVPRGVQRASRARPSPLVPTRVEGQSPVADPSVGRTAADRPPAEVGHRIDEPGSWLPPTRSRSATSPRRRPKLLTSDQRRSASSGRRRSIGAIEAADR